MIAALCRPARGIVRAIVLLWLPIVPAAAGAFCLTAPPPLLALQTMVYADPQAALAAARRALTVTAVSSHRAWLAAIVAAAYGSLELGDDERAAAEAGLKLPLAANDPARLELLVERAMSVAPTAEIAQAIAAIDRARQFQPPKSAANICAMNAIGVLEQAIGHPERATPMLLAAYRAAGDAGLAGQRAAVASSFSAVLKESGDIDAALALNAEELAFTQRRGLTYAVANAQYFRGEMLGQRGDWAAALAAYGTQRMLAVGLRDAQGVAFAELGVCEAALELHRMDSAVAACRAAAQRFAPGKDRARTKVAWLEARIALDQHDPAAAVALLAFLLQRDSVAPAPQMATAVFATRAKAEAALGHYRAAYANLDRADGRKAAAARVSVDHQLATMRARFTLDSQLQRTAVLEGDLRLAAERSSRQRVLIGLSLLATVAIIALLATIVVSDRRHRRVLTRLASDDVLTGLPNRRRVADVAAVALEGGRRNDLPAAIALIDLDHFKSINDRFGHAAGDTVLRAFAAAASALLRESDTIGRWGGEEFLVVLPGCDPSVARATVERLRVATSALRFDFATGLRLTFSAGIVVADPASTLPELIALADRALYNAKSGGRDQIVMASTA